MDFNLLEDEVKAEVIQMDRRRVLKVAKVSNPFACNMHTILREHLGRYVIAEKPYSLYEFDNYLTVVLAFYEGQYVTWTYNDETPGFSTGHYFGGSFSEAVQDYLTRGGFPWKIELNER